MYKREREGGREREREGERGEGDRESELIKVVSCTTPYNMQPGPKAKEWEHLAWARRESEREDALRRKRQQEEEEAIEKAIRDSLKST